jgi:hypothetical protein
MMNVLKDLQTSVMQEINLCTELTIMELTKVTNDKEALQIEYKKFRMEWDEVE